MKIKKSISKLLALTLMIGALTGCSTKATDSEVDAAESIKLVVAHNQTSTDNPYQHGMVKFKEVVEEISDGQIEVEVHAGTIGTNEDELIEKLQLGAVDMVVASPGFMSKIGVPEVDMLSLLYLFDSFEHWESVIDGEFGDEIKKIINEKTNNNFLVADYWSSGVRNFYGKKPIVEPKDVAGLKMRTQNSAVQQEFWKQAGATPTSIAWNELYQALSSNVVDGSENDFTNLMLKDHHKTNNGKFISETEHDYTTRVLLLNGNKFDKYTEEQQNWIKEAIAEATKVERESTYKMLSESKEKVIADGAEVNEVNKEAFKAIALPIQDKFAKDNNMTELLEMARKK